jgi:glycosyltransferase involved in cell wall biosynthesis
MPATTDPLGGLNKPLTQDQMMLYLDFFNQCLFADKQMPLDINRPYIAQIARFDLSKGLPDAIESYRQLQAMLKDSSYPCPQLVLAGNTAIDDPDSLPIYCAKVDLLRSDKYVHLANDVKLGRLPPMDEMLNTLLRKCVIAMQLSLREGFEVKVTEALMKSKPVVAYRAGGIPLQVRGGVDGYLADIGETKQVAGHLYALLTDTENYQRMSRAAACLYNKDYLTVSSAIGWLFLAGQPHLKRQIL